MSQNRWGQMSQNRWVQKSQNRWGQMSQNRWGQMSEGQVYYHRSNGEDNDHLWNIGDGVSAHVNSYQNKDDMPVMVQ